MRLATVVSPFRGANARPSAAVAGRRCAPAMCRSSDSNGGEASCVGRRELVLYSVNASVLGSLLSIGAVARPSNLGVQDYGGGLKTLSLCPPTPNCLTTAEEASDRTHYAPPLTFNPKDGRGSKKPVTQQQAYKELVSVPDGFTPKIVQQTPDYLYVEYSSPIFGFVDDVEFWFKGDSLVEYRSASRIGESDGNVNRKRIKAIREALEPRGWASVGF